MGGGGMTGADPKRAAHEPPLPDAAIARRLKPHLAGLRATKPTCVGWVSVRMRGLRGNAIVSGRCGSLWQSLILVGYRSSGEARFA